MRKIYLVAQEFEENVNDIGVKITNIDSSAGYMYVDNHNYINYSYDGITWRNDYTVIFNTNNSEWGYGEWCIPDPIQSGQSVYLKAASAYDTSRGYTNAVFDTQFKFNIEGDIAYLYEPNGVWDYTKTYKRYFECGTKVVNASKLILSLENLNNLNVLDNSYYGWWMSFIGCKDLIKAPKIKAKILAPNCFNQMFSGCSSLTTAPRLPYTTLANRCYYQMFKNCTALTTPPQLPATTLTTSCYYQMFMNCTALTVAPSLPATTLAPYCYEWMFSGCKALTAAPALPATTLAAYCYHGMFSGCSALVSAPSLPATTVADHCCYEMFKKCSALVEFPELHAITLAPYCYESMFYNCSSLYFSATPTAEFNKSWRIPKTGEGTMADKALRNMLYGTSPGPDFPGVTPLINTTYYTSNTLK